MSPDPPPEPAPRFRPRASGPMADMFDQVSGRYDLLNRLMTLGRDGAWRRALARAVPERARVVLDLCTGNGVSLAGLRRPGRLVLGVDVSPGMLGRALDAVGGAGWSPRLVCADAFRLPLADGSLDAVTIAFGLRNLRPRLEALREIGRVLRPGGTLAVLEATAPGPGPWSALHRFHLRHVVPLLGRLSPDPSAYRYLSDSVFEFGDGSAFERDLERAGFAAADRRSFLLGAARLWSARWAGSAGQPSTGGPASVRPARSGGLPARDLPQPSDGLDREWKVWAGGQLAVSAALTVALGYGLWVFANSAGDLPLAPWQRGGLGWLLVGGTAAFAIRTVILLGRFLGPRPRP